MILPWSNFIKHSHFSAFSSLWLTFSWGFHTYMLTINRAGSVSKTSDTWWKYRYLTLTHKYRQYRYLVSVSCPSLFCWRGSQHFVRNVWRFYFLHSFRHNVKVHELNLVFNAVFLKRIERIAAEPQYSEWTVGPLSSVTCAPMFMQFTGCHQPVQGFYWSENAIDWLRKC